MRTAHDMGIKTVAIYSEADDNALHVRMAGQSEPIGPAEARSSYLNMAAVLDAAKRSGADAVHPGYGFLAENAEFAQMVHDAGLIFVGPPASAIRHMGAKDNAKELMLTAGVPVVPGYFGNDQSLRNLVSQAAEIGFPLLLKAALGGGGKGMRIVQSAEQLEENIASAKREALSSFGDDRLLIERYLTETRHVEVQVFADSHGQCVHLFERDCSLQRRHQKVIEEAPAPGMTEALREKMGTAAVAAARAVDYVGAGTVEFLLAPDNRFYFMEMNTRLQVEHSVSECITGQDFVAWQLKIARGEGLPLGQSDLSIKGHAIEARIYAEDPDNDFLPVPGIIRHLRWPDDAAVRIDTGVEMGDSVSPFYDPMIAKVTCHGSTRTDAIARLQLALRQTEIIGPGQNIGFLGYLLSSSAFQEGAADTSFVDDLTTDMMQRPQIDLARALAACAQLIFAKELQRHINRRTAAADPYSPWQTFDGWRLSGHRPPTIDLAHDGYIHRVAKTDTGFHVEGLFVNSGELAPLRVIENENEFYVFGSSVPYKFILFDALEEQASQLAMDGVFSAPMPGRVTIVNVSKGERVQAGDVLVVLEAMKMEHTMIATSDGTVSDVHVKADVQVPEGCILVTLDLDK